MYQTVAHPDRGRGREAPAPHAHPGDRPHAPGAGPQAEAGDAGPSPESLRVLVVDDAPDVTEMIALMMSYAGYRVATAFSATEALDAARTQHFDAVISDIGMPGMSGYQLAEALRALPAYRSTPLIAVTGFTMYEDRERARSAGFDDFLNKPISPGALLEAVKRLCG
ncbi:MAG TPA: response regulator [Pyrinomonadaceae bacterium]|jgi:CheY-like chemotaxis protein